MGSPILPFSAGAALDELERRFGGPLRDEDAEVAVGTTSVLAAGPDYERMSLTFVNIGTTVLIVRPSSPATTTRGLRLGPLGGTVSFSVQEDATLPCLEWNVISDLAGGVLYRLSVRRETRRPG